MVKVGIGREVGIAERWKRNRAAGMVLVVMQVDDLETIRFDLKEVVAASGRRYCKRWASERGRSDSKSTFHF